jgi:Fe-S cluster biogenesis protein NfuA
MTARWRLLTLAAAVATPVDAFSGPLATRVTVPRASVRLTDEVVSPFDPSAGTKPSAATTAAGDELTVANVDSVLEQVRPYLIADGGNVDVVDTDGAAMTVSLRLVGACGSCESSTTTMKMGIERVLREKWPTIAEVIQVQPEAEEQELTIETAEGALEQILPAVVGLGGKVEILSAAAGKVSLKYEGPEKIKLGIELALRDNELITDVEFV